MSTSATRPAPLLATLPLAALAGLVLSWVVVVPVIGWFAARPVSPAYFAWFGRANNDGALLLLAIPYFVLPVMAMFVLLATPLLVALRHAVAAHALACGLGWLALNLLIGGPWVASWWVLPQYAAPWLGLALAALLARVWLSRGPGGRPTALRRNPR